MALSDHLPERIYGASPVWLQNEIVSARGIQFRLRRSSDGCLREQYQWLMKTQQWGPEEMREYQAHTLREHLRMAFKDVPYYRELKQRMGCEAEDFRSPDDIRLLPTLNKADVRGQEDRFLNSTQLGEAHTKGYTSGTTGSPMKCYETRAAFSKRFAFVARLRTCAGISEPFYPRRAQFTGRDIIPLDQSPSVPVYWRRNRFGNALLFSTTHIAPSTAEHYASALLKYRPELIDGYPSALAAISRLARSMKLRLPEPKAIIVTAETLGEGERMELESAFGCPVFNQYAASEPSCFWCDCEHGVMHENPEYGVSEILTPDGHWAAPGEEGEVVVTSFLNRLMVLIRYRLGDIARRGPAGICSCGRQTQRVAAIAGRRDDVLYFAGRGFVGRLDPVFKGLSNIVEAQIVQEGLDRVRVLLVPAADYTMDVQSQLIENLRQKIGAEVAITVACVDSIPRGPNGKFRAVISKVKNLYPSEFSVAAPDDNEEGE